jgi:prevent-host-death family protein
MPHSSVTSVSTRALRENLRETLEQVAKGKELLVTHRGKPYVRIVPITSEDAAGNRYPLRGSVLFIAEDFDEPMGEAAAPQKKSSKPRKRK